ncbi:MAG TPA: rhodanese-like domain-containing protein [Pyrinomonadaceae bacterium]|jgi:rhodanese-related sulfurtransferase|nr:rhodanese-like domain-containing protein [Pyrinomonadaceae bacterium]
MRHIISFFAVAVFALAVLTACNSSEWKAAQTTSPPPQAPAGTQSPAAPADGARRISISETSDLLAKDAAIVIDVRNQASYEVGHIKGAKLIPLNDVVAHLDELPRNKLIVTYCSCPAEHTAAIAVNNLKGKGVENAAALVGGFPGWQSAGLPVSTGAAP